MISDYPEKTSRGEKNYGIAWYTKETLEPLAEEYNQKFIVLAEKGVDNKPAVFADGKILVLRVFEPQHHTLFPIILRWLYAFSHVKHVYVHSEFCTTGGIRNFILLIPFLCIIKAYGKSVSYFAHNVVTNTSSIGPHLGFRDKSIFLHIFNILLQQYYRILGLLVDRIIVMDGVLEKRLEQYVDKRKIIHIPIWTVTKNKKSPGNNLRKKLALKKNDFVLLYFGFITWYKGADWIIDQVKKIPKLGGKRIRLVLAGGMAYSLKHKKYYQDFYNKLSSSITGAKNITLTDFVDEKDIEKYFDLADVVILPYRGYIGSSGIFSYALSYEKPFILSRAMSEICQNQDFQDAMEKQGVKKSDFIFDHSLPSLRKILLQIGNSKNLEKLQALSKGLQEVRSKEKLIDSYYMNIFKPNSDPSYQVNFLERITPHGILPSTAK